MSSICDVMNKTQEHKFATKRLNSYLVTVLAIIIHYDIGQ